MVGIVSTGTAGELAIGVKNTTANTGAIGGVDVTVVITDKFNAVTTFTFNVPANVSSAFQTYTDAFYTAGANDYTVEVVAVFDALNPPDFSWAGSLTVYYDGSHLPFLEITPTESASDIQFEDDTSPSAIASTDSSILNIQTAPAGVVLPPSSSTGTITVPKTEGVYVARLELERTEFKELKDTIPRVTFEYIYEKSKDLSYTVGLEQSVNVCAKVLKAVNCYVEKECPTLAQDKKLLRLLALKAGLESAMSCEDDDAVNTYKTLIEQHTTTCC
jgi:hypothetical protein